MPSCCSLAMMILRVYRINIWICKIKFFVCWWANQHVRSFDWWLFRIFLIFPFYELRWIGVTTRRNIKLPRNWFASIRLGNKSINCSSERVWILGKWEPTSPSLIPNAHLHGFDGCEHTTSMMMMTTNLISLVLVRLMITQMITLPGDSPHENKTQCCHAHSTSSKG